MTYHPYDPPLKVQSRRFVDAHGRDARLLGVIDCCMRCAKPDGVQMPGWPLTSERTYKEFGEAGFNWTHWNLGPHWLFGWVGRRYITPYPTRNSLVFRPYKTVANDKADLSVWNEPFFDLIRAQIRKCREAKMYVEIDLIDAWLPKDPFSHPWSKNNNVQRFDQGSNAMFSKAPHQYARAWVRKVVAETGDFDNVVYQIGNETFTAPVSEAWERGIVDLVRAKEKSKGFIRHLIGSNSYPVFKQAPWADFESWHGPEVPPRGKRPRQVNEYGPTLTAEIWGKKARQMSRAGGNFAFWISNSSATNIRNAVVEGRKIRGEQEGS